MPLVNVLGAALEVVQIPGPAHRPTLVFLHEGLGSVAMWRDFPARLCGAADCAGLVYSRRGYGQSESIADVRGAGRLKPDYMHREAWEVLPALLSALGITQPILFGHSDGATIALLYASRHAARGCVAMAPHLFVEDISIRSIKDAREAFVHADLRERLARFHADVDGVFWQWNDAWLSPEFRGFNIEAECAQIACPVLAIQGHDDAYGTMAQIEALEIGFPAKINGENSTKTPWNMRRQLLKLEQSGHSPHRDQPELVVVNVCAWIRDLIAA